MIKRLLSRPTKSIFLLGPRNTGKSVWLKDTFQEGLYIDLLKSENFLKYKNNPSILQNEVLALPKKTWIIIDEIQRIPELLNEVHSLLFQSNQNYFFVLSGSSARKLKRSNANMLAGRALYKKMFPFSCLELGEQFSLNSSLAFGNLPLASLAKTNLEKIDFLESYVDTYLKEEIQQEALVRNLNGFYRFLNISSIANAQILNISNIARDVGVARSTVQSYFDILVDTLVGWYLPAYRNKIKIKEIAHPKFFLFDCGVQRTLSKNLRNTPSSQEKGFLFETFILNEVRAINSYSNLGYELFYWRTESGSEVDLLLKKDKKIIAFEIKFTKIWKPKFNKVLLNLYQDKQVDKVYGIYTGDTELLEGPIRVLPYKKALEMIKMGKV